MNNNKILTCEQANESDLVDFLATLGYQPARVSKQDYWYHSPLRTENTPSFKINRKQNVWYDHGIGIGGGLIDFGIRYFQCSVKDLLERLQGNNFISHVTIKNTGTGAENRSTPIRVICEVKLSSLSLLRYIRQRRIAIDIAEKFCCEVRFMLNKKMQVAIGFRNNEGGYELRNPWFKGSSSPKAITTIHSGADSLAVFEGFFDLLSWLSLHQHQQLPAYDFMVLNSASLFEKNRELMEAYGSIHLYLDNDPTGQKCIRQALSWSDKYKDESGLYKGYKDLNEWVQQIGKSTNRSMKQRF